MLYTIVAALLLITSIAFLSSLRASKIKSTHRNKDFSRKLNPGQSVLRAGVFPINSESIKLRCFQPQVDLPSGDNCAAKNVNANDCKLIGFVEGGCQV